MDKNNWISYPQRRGVVTFKKDYTLSKKAVSAYIDITAIGWYHCYINGKRMDTSVFSPGWTDYKKRVQFQHYEIADIKENLIHLSVDLGEGWGGGDRFAWTSAGTFRYFPMCLNFTLVVNYEDGTKEEFHSDSSMDTYSSFVTDASIYYGETQDCFAPIEYLGKAKTVDVDTNIVPNEGLEIVYGERFPAQKMWKDPKGNLLVDFGQNFAGVIEIKIKAKKGDKITYRPCEVLDKDGVFYNDNYRKCKNGFYSFVCSGEEDIFIPQFSFLGGRYICLEEYPENIAKENFTAIFVHSDLHRTNSFECGNPKIQRLYLNTYYGMISNYLDVPTDCPQRDERLGWTADAQVFAPTAAIHCNVLQFFRKWLHDAALGQREDGAMISVIPHIYAGDNVSTGWGDACTFIPMQMYRAYGDKTILEESLPMMEKWVRYLLSQCDEYHILELPFTFGDWLALDKVQDGECRGLTRYDMMSTAFLAYDLKLVIDARKALSLDCSDYETLYKQVKEAYQNRFIKDGHMVGEKIKLFENKERSCYTQTGLAMTLYFDLCKKEDKESLASDLAELVHECGDLMSTGFIGTAYILQALSDNGYRSLAYTLLFQEGYPSWLYSVNKGATTMWEHYDGIKEDGSFWFDSMNSYNHYAYGAVYGWIFENAVGITPIEPGYSVTKIAPKPDRRFGRVDSSFDTAYGTIRVRWEYEGEKVNFDIFTSENMKTLVELPNGETMLFNEATHIERTIDEKDLAI